MDLRLTNTTLTDSFVTVLPVNEIANNPDPRPGHNQDIFLEDTVIGNLEEDFTYQFTIYMSNSVGKSDAISSSMIQLPGAGKYRGVIEC